MDIATAPVVRSRPLGVLVWHVHGSWSGNFMAGRHSYYLPVVPGETHGRKRAEWPASVREVEAGAIDPDAIDVVVFQNLEEIEAAERWLRGRRVPAIYVEHNTPQGRINEMRHPLADRDDVTIVHVTHCNALFWDTGSTRTRVIEHGIADPGRLYDGSIPHAAVAINEAKRRGRVTGTDLLPRFGEAAPIDLFGIGTDFDLPQRDLHRAMARRRLYLHPYRWTSLGLSLLEAMMLGMPVVALATSETPRAVPPEAGICTCDLDAANATIRRFVADPAEARACGDAARAYALAHYSLEPYLAKWDALLAEVAAS